MTTSIYNTEGEEVGKLDLRPEIFNVKSNATILHEVIRAQRSVARKSIAHTKDRSEVRGGGAKPWRQKGTGRARHGSSRSPIWSGGGVTFGPLKTRRFAIKVNKKVKRQALFMSLSEKAQHKGITVLEKIEMPEIKSKQIIDILKKLKIEGKKVLLSLEKKNENIIKSAQNIPAIALTAANSLNVIDILHADVILTTVDGIETIEKTYLQNKNATTVEKMQTKISNEAAQTKT